MKVKIFFAVILVILVSIVIAQRRRISGLQTERDAYKGNSEALLLDSRAYAVRDSLQAAKVQSLELTLAEYKRFRVNDLALIQDLDLRVKDLTQVNTAQAQTILELRSTPRDTFVLVRDSIVVPALTVHCGDAYYDFDGLVTKDAFTGRVAVRDSLLITESVEYRRFLGFLWRTRKIKSRQMDVVSRNPHTRILDVEHIIIRK